MKRISSILLGAIMALSLFAMVGSAGQNGETSGESSSQSQTQTIVPAVEIGEEMDGETLWNSFEYFDRDVQLVRLMDDFGRVSQNKDLKYVRTGTKSLQITPMAKDAGSASNPYMLIPATSTRFADTLDFVDFTKVDYVSLWFYNPMDEEVEVGVSAALGSAFDLNRKNYAHRIQGEFYSLKKGWNHVIYTIMPGHLILQGAIMAAIHGLVLEFDHAQVHERETPFSVYLDDLTIAYTDEAKPTEVDYAAGMKSGVAENGNQYWEITDFEDSRQAYYFYYWYAFPSPVQSYPYVRTVFAGDYGVSAKSGTQALLIRKCYGDTSYGWPIVRLNTDVMKAALDNVGEDLYANPQNYELKLELYNASEGADSITIELFGYNVNKEMLVQPKQWLGFSINMSRFSLTDPLSLEFRWSTRGDMGYSNFLLDNIRIEKVA